MPTQSLFAVYLFAVAVSLGAVISPGPVTAAIVSESPRQGWRVGPLVASAHVLLELVIVVLIALGLASGLATPGISRTIALGGGVILLAIGASYLVGLWRGSIQLPHASDDQPPRSTASLLSLGLFTTISNPYWYAWWVTVAAGYLTQAGDLGPIGPAVFYLGHISTDFAWDTALSTASGASRRWLTQRVYRAIILLTAVFMLYFGLVFLKAGWTG